ncbi:afba4948-3a35-4a79-81ff-3f8bffac9db0 [Sclerotinia trifoliorum]|uniref:Afba4948-3a35-4a79-81ff-3f8bffac9db0 n=1 Tax=Sclerotinia trifoliorum TaxID=28548 RepID=A0A8H2VXV1_9HELO|nr:afba4948-3a35-4a79-81ff-3f8bffac9db0 [Sclerotinia trifoliorum]
MCFHFTTFICTFQRTVSYYSLLDILSISISNMSGSGSGNPPPPILQGLGITSNPISGSGTPNNAFGGNNQGPAINNPRTRRGSTQTQQQMKQQINPSMLRQPQAQGQHIQEQQIQHMQRQHQQMQQNQIQQQQAQQQQAQQQQAQQQQAQQQQAQQQQAQQQVHSQQMHTQKATNPNLNPSWLELQGLPIDPTIQHLLAAGQAVNPTQYRLQRGMPHPFPPNGASVNAQPTASGEQEEDEEEEGEKIYETSTLHLQINSPLTITGDNNIITLHPSPQIQNITDAVLNALKSVTEGTRGLPMGDAEGTPRGIRIDVMAAIEINGQHNVIGEEAVKVWGQKVKAEAMVAQNHSQRLMAQANVQFDAQARNHMQAAHTQAQAQAQAQVQNQGQEQGWGQGHGQGQGHGHRQQRQIMAPMQGDTQRQPQAIGAITQTQPQNSIGQRQTQAQPQAAIVQRQTQPRTHIQGHPQPQPQATTQQQAKKTTQPETANTPGQIVQAQVQAQAPQNAGVMSALASKDSGKRGRGLSMDLDQNGEEGNKKTKMGL